MTDTLPEEFRRMLKSSIGETAYGHWFANVEFSLPDNHSVLLDVPSRFAADYIEANFSNQVVACCRKTGVNVLKARYRLNRTDKVKKDGGTTPRSGARVRKDGLDPRYTFERFIVGKSNESAHAATLRVSETFESFGSTLYLHGGVGLGKTHLLKAVGWAIRNSHPDCRMRYMTSELFTSQFVSSSRSRKIHEFRERIRALDVLMIDDIQFIAGKAKTTEELELTIDAMTSEGSLVILSGNSHIDNFQQFDSRLKSRILHGVGAGLAQPDMDLRLSILEAKLREMQDSSPMFRLADGVLEFVADRVTGDIRRLEGALSRLSAATSYIAPPISRDHAVQLLADLIEMRNVRPEIDVIVKEVARHYGLKPADLASKKRNAKVVMARQVAIYLAKDMTTRSIAQIGSHFARDHTTVAYSIKRIRGLCNSRLDVVNDVDSIRKRLSQPA